MKTLQLISLIFCFGILFNSCQKEDPIPTSVTITKIDLTNYPLDNNGSNWDASGGTFPDPFITINQGTTTNTTNFYSDYVSDAAGVTISYVNKFPYTISDLSQDWAYGVWDFDGSLTSSDYMNGLTFKFETYLSTKPETLTLTAGNITMKFYVTWNY